MSASISIKYMTNKIPTTGDVYKIQNNRFCVVANSITLDSLVLYNILPVSSAIYMASDKDFLLIEEPVFKKQTVMVETWNSLAVPIEFFDTYKLKGRLSDKYVRYLSSYIYFALQNRKNESLTILTGPPISSSSDIRWLFRQMEIKEFHALRKILVSVASE
jgi:hypothetical protein